MNWEVIGWTCGTMFAVVVMVGLGLSVISAINVRKRREELAEVHTELAIGCKVICCGGIFGKVVGINDNDEVVNTIAWAQKKFARINPTSSLALEVLNAYEKLAPTVKDNTDMVRSISEIAVNYNYVTPVRQKALSLLKTLTGR